MRKIVGSIVGSIVSLSLLVGCVEALDLTGRACPCVSGWECNPSTNTCVAEGTLPSGTNNQGPDAGPDGAPGPGDDGGNDGGDDGPIVVAGCQNRFCLVHPRSQLELTDVWVRGSNDVIVVGEEGRIFRYDGSQLTRMASPFIARYAALWGIPDHLYAAGSVGGNVMHQQSAEWQVLPSITLANFSALWGNAANNIYAVGRVGGRGQISHYDGVRISNVFSLAAIETELYGVWGSGSDNIFAVGNSGTIVHFDGNEWTEAASPTDYQFERISGIDAANVLAITGRDLFKFNGSEWNIEPSPSAFLYDVWMRSANEFYTIHSTHHPYTEIYRHQGGTFEPILRLNDLGDTTSDQSQLTRVRGSATGNDLYAVGKNGAMLHYDGATWREVSYGSGPIVNSNYKGLWCRNTHEAWAAAEDGSIIRYDGKGWRQVFADPLLTFTGWNGIWGDDESGELFVVGGSVTSGAIWHFDRTTWEKTTPATLVQLRAVWGTDDEHVVAVGDSGTALRYDGASWQPFAGGTGTTRDLVSIWGTSMNNLYAVGRDNTDSVILHYDGNDWLPIPATQMVGLKAISGSSASNIYAVGDGGTILHFNGTAWRVRSSPTTEALRSVWVGDTRDVLVAGGDETYFHFNGTAWRAVEAEEGSNPQAISACSDEMFFVAGYNASMQSAGILNMTR